MGAEQSGSFASSPHVWERCRGASVGPVRPLGEGELAECSPRPRLRAFADWFPLSSPLSPSRTLSPQGLLSQSLCSLSHVRPADPEVGPDSVLRAPQATPVLSPECGPQQHPLPVSWQRPRTAAPPLASPACAGRPCGEDAAEHLSGAPHPPQHRHGSSS